MPEILTPGVYIEEVSSGVRPIMGVETSVTAFVGLTEHGPVGTPTQVGSMAEFERVFGGPPKPVYRIEHMGSGAATPVTNAPALPPVTFTADGDRYALVADGPDSVLYASLRLFFRNGGSRCIIVSAGTFDTPLSRSLLTDAIDALSGTDGASLLAVPDATRLPQADAARVNRAMLAHCAAEKFRFAIIDIPRGHLGRDHADGDPVAQFRADIGAAALDHGATYYPWLRSVVFAPKDFTFDNIHAKSRPLLEKLLAAEGTTSDAPDITGPTLSGDFTIIAQPGQTVALTLDDFRATDDSRARDLRYSILDDGAMGGKIVSKGSDQRRTGFRQRALAKGKLRFVRDNRARDPGRFDLIVTDKDGQSSARRTVFVVSDEKAPAGKDIAFERARADERDANQVRQVDLALRRHSALYVQMTRVMCDTANLLPPSAAMAGIYARIDASRGVWKAPAGVDAPLMGVQAAALALNDRAQQDLNTSPDGKSVNAIRAFTGQGLLPWGARTLAGNDNEWRYVPVRRTALMLLQSVQQGTEWAVFEPNDANLWTSLKASTRNFLTTLWRSGALAGSTPDEAFFVKVGLGETMAGDDIQNGRLIVDIGFAPVRPAEFVILRIQHRTQTP